MKLLRFRSPSGEKNFGDELGPWLWDRLLPNVFDDDESEIFVGLGTLLNNRLPRASRVVVLGAGVGYGDSHPVVDGSWSIYCLRGPLSARVLGASPALAATDPGALVRQFFPPAEPKAATDRFAYMPHWRWACEEWKEVCERIGFGYIDPRADVDEVIRRIRGTRVLVAEALHGAIVADALRVPWIPVRSTPAILDFKWRDWCASIGLPYSPHRIVPVFPLWKASSGLSLAKYAARLRIAGVRLLSLTVAASPMLSNPSVLAELVGSLNESLVRFRRDLGDATSRLPLPGRMDDPPLAELN